LEENPPLALIAWRAHKEIEKLFIPLYEDYEEKREVRLQVL
jgi:hypothetical protein